jgi:carboxypeptidase PM20D1
MRSASIGRLFLAAASCVAATAAVAQNRSVDYAEPYQRHALEIFRASIAFRSATPHGQVPALADYLADQFRDGGFADEEVHVLPLTQPDGEETASLIVRYRGDPASGQRPLLLVAHMDVVDAVPSDWERDPFTLIEADGYFFGRGTLDDKFGTTMLTSAFLRLKAEGYVPSRDLVLAFTGDEETRKATTRDLVTTHRELTDAEFALNADAGWGVLDESGNAVSYLLQTAEKTYVTFELTIRNPGGHSAQPRQDNAIYELARVLQNIAAHRFPLRSSEATQRYFETTGTLRGGELGEAMRRFAADLNDEEAAEILFADPTQVGLTRTTCVATMLSAGHAENALPQSATATVNCRVFPDVEVSEIQATLARIAGNDDLEISIVGNVEQGPSSPLREEVIAAIETAVHQHYPGIPVIPYMSSYSTDGVEIRAAGIPTYGTLGVFMRESEDFSHGLNERVPVQSFFRALDWWPTIIKLLAGP